MAAASQLETQHDIPWWRSFVFRLVGIYTLFTVVALLVSLYFLNAYQKREVEERFGMALEGIASTAAPFIDGSDIEAISSNADTDKEAFRRLRETLAEIARLHNLNAEQIYILRPADADHPDQLEFVVMLQEKTFVGDPYLPPDVVVPEYRWVMSQNDAVRTPLYTDDHGTFISGIAPILDGKGRAIAVLQVDYGIDRYLNEVTARNEMLLGGGGLILLFLLGLGFWMHRVMRRKVHALLAGTRAIQEEDYDYIVALHGSDELASVASALNRVLEQLKERFEMLKFLPRHTTEMIRRASADGGSVRLDIGRRVEVVVMESDIRGFSAISEHLSPEEVIGMLNHYIRVQADLIEVAGGSIDKYMGDAVLAVFEREDKVVAATRCALEIQREVARLNREQVFEVPVHIGVGLSLGEVVMGNMGSEQRMEHTVIGAVVNMAARLCSVAKGGEVVVEEAIWQTAGDALDIEPISKEQVRVKGFEALVTVRRLLPVPVAGPAEGDV